jgi:hypothetical protein
MTPTHMMVVQSEKGRRYHLGKDMSQTTPGVHLAQNIAIPHGRTGEIGSTKTLDLPVCLLFLPLLAEKQKRD